MSTVALGLYNVCKSFGGLKASNNINIEVLEHEIYGIIGPNGAGKTTLFNLITGVIAPTSGTIRIYDKDITNLAPDKICGVGIARTFQNIRLFNAVSVLENLMIACQQTIHYSALDGCLRTPRFRREEKAAQEKCMAILEKFNLLQYKDVAAGKLPYGSQRRVEIMRAIMTNPRVVLLDEPAAGMNEEETATLAEMIRMLQKEYNLTIVVIDHHMDLIMEICDRLTVINFGEQLMTGTPEQAQSDQKVIDAYLGVDDE